MTYDGYLLLNSNHPEKPEGTIWWDGDRIRCSNDAILHDLKKQVIPFRTDSKKGTMLTYSDGKDFFDMLHMLYRNGYMRLKDITVDKEGNEV